MRKRKDAYALWTRDESGEWSVRFRVSTANSWMLDLKGMLEMYAERTGLDPEVYRILPAGRRPALPVTPAGE